MLDNAIVDSTPPFDQRDSVSSRVIRLHAGDAIDIRAEDVYFPFIDGSLTYDCVTCQSQCCRGNGYNITFGRELETQLAGRVGLPLFLERPLGRNSNQLTMANCKPGCFFMAQDGLCEIHVTQGYEAKPETCRLFPFNQFLRFGNSLIVAPHLELCPLGIAAAGAPSTASRHDDLMAAMALRGLSTAIPSAPTFSRDPREAIAHERRIVALADPFFVSGDYLAFIRAQEDLGSPNSIENFDADQSAIDRMIALSSALFDTPPASALGHNRELGRTMVAVTPALRSRFLFRKEERRSNNTGALPVERVPRAILALCLFVESAHRAGTSPITFQTITTMMAPMEPLARLLATADQIFVWQRGMPIEVSSFPELDFRKRFVRLARELLPARQRRQPRPLGDLLLEHAPADPIRRVLFVKDVARYVLGRVVPIDAEAKSRHQTAFPARVRASVHRWALMHLDETALMAGYARTHNSHT